MVKVRVGLGWLAAFEIGGKNCVATSATQNASCVAVDQKCVAHFNLYCSFIDCAEIRLGARKSRVMTYSEVGRHLDIRVFNHRVRILLHVDRRLV